MFQVGDRVRYAESQQYHGVVTDVQGHWVYVMWSPDPQPYLDTGRAYDYKPDELVPY